MDEKRPGIKTQDQEYCFTNITIMHFQSQRFIIDTIHRLGMAMGEDNIPGLASVQYQQIF